MTRKTSVKFRTTIQLEREYAGATAARQGAISRELERRYKAFPELRAKIEAELAVVPATVASR